MIICEGCFSSGCPAWCRGLDKMVLQLVNPVILKTIIPVLSIFGPFSSRRHGHTFPAFLVGHCVKYDAGPNDTLV